jgi:hypothetical protein
MKDRASNIYLRFFLLVGLGDVHTRAPLSKENETMTILENGMEPEEIREALVNELRWHLEATLGCRDIYDGREVEDACVAWMAEDVEFSSAGMLRGSEYTGLYEPAAVYVDHAIDDFANNGGCLDQLPAILNGYRQYCDDCRDQGFKFVLALDPAESYLDGGFAVLCDHDGIEFARVLVDVRAHSVVTSIETMEA